MCSDAVEGLGVILDKKRIYGITKEKRKFVVQVKQIKRTGKLYLMSVYPI